MNTKKRKEFFNELTCEEKSCYLLNKLGEIAPVKEMQVQKVEGGKVVEEIQIRKKELQE